MTTMDRREFLRRALSLAPVAIVLPSVTRVFFLPPRGGWPTSRYWELSGEQLWWKPYNDLVEGKLAKAINPALMGDLAGDLQAFGTAILRTVPGAIHRVPPHEWHRLEIDAG